MITANNNKKDNRLNMVTITCYNHYVSLRIATVTTRQEEHSVLEYCSTDGIATCSIVHILYARMCFGN
jgi:hypothetical protein